MSQVLLERAEYAGETSGTTSTWSLIASAIRALDQSGGATPTSATAQSRRGPRRASVFVDPLLPDAVPFDESENEAE